MDALGVTVVAVEPATDVVIGGVDSEQPTRANKIVASTSGAPRRRRAATTPLRHTGSLPSTASESDALSGEGRLFAEAYVPSVLPRSASLRTESDRLER